MSLVQCRLHPISIEESILRKYQIPVRYNSLQQDYLKYRLKEKDVAIKENLLLPPYEIKELLEIFPWFDPESLVIEVGCGTGDFLIHIASENPKINFIGIDIAYPCIQRAIRKASQQSLKNIFFYAGLINDFLFHDFKKIQFDEIMVNFPDPWPKKRHIKRRIINERFVKKCFDLLKTNGKIYSATDVKPLYEYHLMIFESTNFFEPLFDQPFNDIPSRFYEYQSKYQLKNLAKSNQVYYTAHVKKNKKNI